MAGPDDSAYQDNPYGTTDPTALFQKLTDENAKDYQTGGMRQGMMQLGFNPAMQHANAVQSSLRQILSNVGDAPEGEDPLQTQLRQARAVAQGMLNVDPNVAVRANQQVIRLEQAQKQQAALQAETEERQATAKEKQIKNTQARTIIGIQGREDMNGITLRTTSAVGSLDPNSPTYATDLADILRKNPGAVPYDAATYERLLAADNANRASAQYYGSMHRAQQTADYAGRQTYEQLTDQQKDTAAYQWAIDPKSQPADLQEKGERRFNEYVSSGDLQQGDQTAAQAELGALKRSTLTAAQREGTIRGLNDSLVGMGDNVKRNLDKAVSLGVSPTDMKLVNAAVNSGDANFMLNDHTEKGVALRNLFVSINAFLYEHGRLLSGGGARTNVAAVKDAKKNMTANDSPDVIRGAVDTITKQELPVLQNANSAAIIALANPKQYPALGRMMKVFGGQAMLGGRDDQSLTASPAAPGQNPTGATPQGANAAPKAPPAPVGAGHGTSAKDFSRLWSSAPAGAR